MNEDLRKAIGYIEKEREQIETTLNAANEILKTAMGICIRLRILKAQFDALLQAFEREKEGAEKPLPVPAGQA